MCIGTESATLSAHAPSVGIPRVDREIEAAHVVAPGPQAAGRPGDGERLMAELVGRDEEHLHVMTISMRAAAARSAASTAAGVSARANRKPR